MFKKIICGALAGVIMSGAFCSFACCGESNKYLIGDSDLSGSIGINDCTLIQKHLAKMITMSQTQKAVSDVNSDNEVSILDATLIQKYLAKLPINSNIGEEITIGGEIMDKKIDVYFSNNKNWSNVYIYQYNNTTGAEKAAWPGVKMNLKETNTFGEQIFTANVDTLSYDRIIFNNGASAQTMNIPVSCCNSGFYISGGSSTGYQVGVYAYGSTQEGSVKSVKLEYSTGYNKEITIWTPADYNPADSSVKYDVVYLIDGQNMFSDSAPFGGGWGADENATVMSMLGGRKTILVGIDNANSKRDSELTPNLGTVISDYNSGGFANPTGDKYCDFVVNKVMPYINSNYNVYTDKSHTAIAGSSSGGIESFYIGLEHSDKFGFVGSLSPAFMLFTKSQWDAYFDKLNISNAKELPRIYISNGYSDSLEKELYQSAADMKSWITAKGYPAENIMFEKEDSHVHNEACWRIVMPKMFAFLYNY